MIIVCCLTALLLAPTLQGRYVKSISFAWRRIRPRQLASAALRSRRQDVGQRDAACNRQVYHLAELVLRLALQQSSNQSLINIGVATGFPNHWMPKYGFFEYSVLRFILDGRPSLRPRNDGYRLGRHVPRHHPHSGGCVALSAQREPGMQQDEPATSVYPSNACPEQVK